MLNKNELKVLKNIIETAYMKPTISLIDRYVEKKADKLNRFKKVFDELYTILNEAKPFVDDYLEKRKKRGEIKDEKQALKSIAGNSFTQALIYVFLKNKEIGNIRDDIFITSKISTIPSFNDVLVINVDGETQKPDCDKLSTLSMKITP